MERPTPEGDIARLYAIRALMASLKEEEAALRGRLLTLGDGVHGCGNQRVRIVTKPVRRLDRRKLPPDILADPAIWSEVETRSVRLMPGGATSEQTDLLEEL